VPPKGYKSLTLPDRLVDRVDKIGNASALKLTRAQVVEWLLSLAEGKKP